MAPPSIKALLLTALQLLPLINAYQEVSNPANLRHARMRREARPQFQPQANPGYPNTFTPDAREAPTTYTIITPSPGATTVPITQQYQVVDSYVPSITLCGMKLEPVTPSSLPSPSGAPRYPNGTARYPYYPVNATMSGAPRVGTGYSYPTAGSGGRYGNVSTMNPVPSSTVSEWCETTYSPTKTTVCATTLTGIATQYPVIKCDQHVTFSSRYGYIVSDPAGVSDVATLPADKQPPIVTQTTYYQAPWNALTSGDVPPHPTEVVCSTPVGGISSTCVDIKLKWQTRTVSTVFTTTSDIDISTTITGGPGTVIVESFHAPITETETIFTLSTRMVLEYSTETVTTSMATMGTGFKTTPAAAGLPAQATATETRMVYKAKDP